MAENIVINGKTYTGTKAVDLLNENGETVFFYPDAVRYNKQTLTDEQKAQARENIGAMAQEEEPTPDSILATGTDFVAVENASMGYGKATINPPPNSYGVFHSRNVLTANMPTTVVNGTLEVTVADSLFTLNGTGSMAWYEVPLDTPVTVKSGGYYGICRISGTVSNYMGIRGWDSSGNQTLDMAVSTATGASCTKFNNDVEIATLKLYVGGTQTFDNLQFIIVLFQPTDAYNVPSDDLLTTRSDFETVKYGEYFKIKPGYNAIMAAGEISFEYYATNPNKSKNSNNAMTHILKPGVNTVAISGALGVTVTNTLESIHQSYLAGADAVELDLRLTSDGKLVLAHSHLLNNVVDVSTLASADSYPINNYTAAVVTTLPCLNYATYFTNPVYIPLFTDALNLCKSLGLKVWIDLKTDSGTPEYTNAYEYIDSAISAVKNAGMMDMVVFTNAYDEFRKYIREEVPEAWIAVKTYIEGTTVEEDIAKTEEIGGNVVIQLEPSGTAWSAGILTDDRLSAYHSAGYKIGAPYVPYDGKLDYVMSTDKAPFIAPKKFKNSVSHIASEWACSEGTVAIETSSNFGSVIAVTDDRLNWNEIARLSPQIDCYISDITKTARATYDAGLKKIAILLYDSNGKIDIQSYTGNFILTLVVTFC